VSAPTTPVDLVILGGGSGGYAAALRAAELGLSVVLIE
jgi:dihydrolipoamide dehydrogenase